MPRVATSRLTEAMASLPPADRALVNLWVNRGLDDAALAALLDISEETIASRRARIVERLSGTLGLPPDHVHAALNEITVASGLESTVASSAESTVASTAGNGDAAGPASPVGETNGAHVAASPEAVPAPRRRHRAKALGLVLVAIAGVCILVVSLASSGSTHRRRPTAAGGSTRTVPTSPASSATRRSGGGLLAALPGGTGHASGSIAISAGLTLSLRVRDLTPASHGHYELWLYDSLTNSVPLGRLRTGVDHLSLPLPRDADRYHWIDISFQPVGAVFHSGESVLRAVNPLFGRAATSKP